MSITISILCFLANVILIRQARRFPAPFWHFAVIASGVFFLLGLVFLWQGIRASLAQG